MVEVPAVVDEAVMGSAPEIGVRISCDKNLVVVGLPASRFIQPVHGGLLQSALLGQRVASPGRL